MRIAIFQNKILPYRVPIFNRLAARLDVLSVFAAEARTSHHFDLAFEFEKVRHLNFGRLKFTDLRRGDIESFDAFIVMFDLTWDVTWKCLMYRKSVPIVYWGHGLGRYSGFEPINRVRVRLVKTCEATLLYSDEGRSEFLRRGVPAEKLFVARNTLEVPNSGIDLNSEKNTFLFVGRLQERKRIDLLLRAFAEARGDLPPMTTVTVLGNGDLRQRLQGLAEQLGIHERVQFLPGTYDEAALKKVYDTAIAYVSPGHVGLGVVQAMAYGVPVVTSTRYPHAPEYENCRPDNSILYDEDDGLPEVLRRLANRPQERDVLAKNAMQHYEQYCKAEDMISGFMDAIAYARQKRIPK